jgi:hypothetical protein
MQRKYLRLENLTTGILMLTMFPEHMGMNCQIHQFSQKWFRVPHASGDEGESVFRLLSIFSKNFRSVRVCKPKILPSAMKERYAKKQLKTENQRNPVFIRSS